MRRLVIADDDAEARLISALSSLPLDVISKASPLMFYRMPYLHRWRSPADNGAYRQSGELHQNCTLSPTERRFLRFRVERLLNAANCRPVVNVTLRPSGRISLMMSAGREF